MYQCMYKKTYIHEHRCGHKTHNAHLSTYFQIHTEPFAHTHSHTITLDIYIAVTHWQTNTVMCTVT